LPLHRAIPPKKVLVANLPGAEIGSILEYEIVSTVNGKPFFSTAQMFNGHEPIDRKTFTLTIPETMEIKTLSKGIKKTQTASDGTLSYTWEADQQSAVKKEENLPPWWTFNPSVFISSSDWKTYGNEVRDHLNAAAKNQKEAILLAKELIEGLDTDEEKVTSLRDWVAENLRPAGPGLTRLPLSAITPADETLKDRYGNNTDRMVVFYALLKAAKLKPEFVLSGAISPIPEVAQPQLSVPSRSAFNHVLIKVDIGGETIFLNGESQYAELGTSAFDHRPVLNLKNGSFETLRVAPGKDDQSHVVYEISISADGEAGLTLNSTIQGTAFEAFHKQYAEITPEKRRRHYLELVSNISQSAKAVSELTTDYRTYPGKQEFSISADRYAVLDGEFLYFTLPGGLGGLLQYRSNEREHPLEWNRYIDSVVEYNIILPDGYEPAILPKSFSWQAPSSAGLIEIAVEYSARANAIHLVQMADLKPAIISADDFPEVLETGRKLAHPDMRTILLKRK